MGTKSNIGVMRKCANKNKIFENISKISLKMLTEVISVHVSLVIIAPVQM